jgi:hypothetical protein
LPGISGEHALYLRAVTADAVSEAVGHLIGDDARRNELAAHVTKRFDLGGTA